MEQWIWIFIIAVIILSLIGSIPIVAYVVKKSRKHEAEGDINRPKSGTYKVTTTQGRRWNRIITVYLFLCLTFIVIILCQSVKGANRDVSDFLAVPVGAIFFLIQASSTRNRAITRERATTYTMASFVGGERRTNGGVILLFLNSMGRE